ncbi:hypothetical protein NEOLI_003642 [Neolecta irregularis DAH-3]|uniref:Uncharacterized protein n=1 Tax=Neolecta irregularis (strain DAH-3) TaxID=1198029 RepID=A0A1U7LTC2_NEOID|nr:hypothetical protein NEOLI_003642 [Neolecta irregularis DAH-3]|eukprot:OLL25792.1 hypothetical protein NEOLI_003642 [Neolecta irregularis DAH-3]
MQFTYSIPLILAPYVIATNWLDPYTTAHDGGIYHDIPAILIKKLSYIVPLYEQDTDYLASWNSVVQFCAKACTESTETHDPCRSFQIEFPSSSTPERIFTCNTFRLPAARDLDSQVIEPFETESMARVTFTLADSKFFVPDFENKLYRSVYDFNTWTNNLGQSYNIPDLENWNSQWKHNDILHRHLYPTFPSRFRPNRDIHNIMQVLSTLKGQNSSPISPFEILSSYLPILASSIDDRDGESFSVTVGNEDMQVYSMSWVNRQPRETYHSIVSVREYTFEYEGKKKGALGLFVAEKETYGDDPFTDKFWSNSIYFPTTIDEEIPEPIRNQIQTDFISFLQNALPSSWELSQTVPLLSGIEFNYCTNGSSNSSLDSIYGLISYLIKKVVPGFYALRGDSCLLLQDLVMNALGKVYGITARDLDRGIPRFNPPSIFKAKLSDIAIMTFETQESETESWNAFDVAQTENDQENLTESIFINNELEYIDTPPDVFFQNGFWFSSTIEPSISPTHHNQVVLSMKRFNYYSR